MPDALSKDQSSPRSTVLIASIGPETISDGQGNDGDLSYSAVNVFAVPLQMEDDVFGEGRASRSSQRSGMRFPWAASVDSFRSCEIAAGNVLRLMEDTSDTEC